jgi:hypothetical protein
MRPCPACGFDAAAVAVDDVRSVLLAQVPRWRAVLADGQAARRRPQPQVWSPLEYACHVRDVCGVFTDRLELMLAADDPQFANWDQDATAASSRYDLADPGVVADELHAAASAMARTLERVEPGDLTRPGRRSNGSVFTVDSLLRYFLHDVVHHGWDVGLTG